MENAQEWFAHAAAAAAAHAAAFPPAPAAPALVAPVAVKLPSFWVEDPNLWFAQAESIFRRSRVTAPLTMYDHVMAVLPQNLLPAIRDLLPTILEDNNPYEVLKLRLVQSFGPTTWQLCNKLIDHPGLGDGRPTQLMNEMQALLPPGEPAGLIFQALYLRRLPVSLREHLGARKFENARELAAAADLLWDARNAGMSPAVAALEVDAVGATRPASGRPARRPGAKSHQPSADGAAYCRFHTQWGTAAHRCIKPCAWPGNLPAAGKN
jgi:hypothetical protein